MFWVFSILWLPEIYCQIDVITDDTPLALRGACMSNPCLNNGLCTATSSGFLCTCLGSHIGVQCERRADDCSRDNQIKCVNGVCRLDLVGKPRCLCDEGYQGKFCSLDIDNCKSAPCLNDGTCFDKADGFECQCLSGTSGKQCQIKDHSTKQCTILCGHYSNDGKCWHEQRENVMVAWGYGDNVCNSKETCFNSSTDSKRFLEVQLKPVHMQINDELVFITDSDAALYDYDFVPHILPMEADSEEAFQNCNTTDAVPITDKKMMSKVNVNATLLHLGTQYFIADMNEIHRCVLGLRLNVTVKERDCHDPMHGSKQTCHGRGKCYSDFLLKSYQCICCAGYVGRYCEYEDPCFTKPCANDATCESIDVLTDAGENVLKHHCICPEGYQGSDCNHVIDACEEEPCRNDGWCISQKNSYFCECKDGFSGENCEINHNECASQKCMNGGSCVDGMNKFHCNCIPGFKGTLCEVDIDDCAARPCLQGTCLDHINNFTCACHAGYVGRKCDVRLNECESQPCVNGKCVSRENEYFCSCGIGYTGMHCELKLDLCTYSQFCISTNSRMCKDEGSNVSCVCKDGWTGSNCRININDCYGHKCKNGGRCIDNVNGYQCKCDGEFTGQFCEIFPPKEIADVEIQFMTDNCEKFHAADAIGNLQRNIVSLIHGTCQCPFHNSLMKESSVKVQCDDKNSGSFSFDFVNDGDSGMLRSVICGVLRLGGTGINPSIGHNTYLVSTVDRNQICAMNEEVPIENIPPPEVVQEDTNLTGLVIGSVVGVLLLVLLLVLVSIKVRNSRIKIGISHKFEKETIAFDNAAYKGETAHSDGNSTGSIYEDETSFITEDSGGDGKWAHCYDRSRQLYERDRVVPTGRLFDVHAHEKTTEI